MKLLDNKPVQTFLAVAPVLLAALCFIGYFAFFVSVFGSINHGHKAEWLPVSFLNNMDALLLAAFVLPVLFILSTVYFVLHAAQNPLLEKGNMRVVWILIIILLSVAGNFIYWLLEIRNKRTEPVIGDALHRKKQAGWSGGLYMKN
ncbi:hypothetical protein U0035_15715 [Niabella yanshanensis]|uniref:Cardiolipin synthase N-terminal domain-containing protein n=1 Tax=Niabella yanshanensis TaxID=577386 RepID=A0ABZ0W1G9_9BACT|nr:hypothetical protein [Niabella yanshanensis]WQD37118.1 hypothetical protein U0035_15715 [Niabella yanshanensis]